MMDLEHVLTDKDYEIAKRNGIPRKIVNTRFNDLYWNKEDCITKPVRPYSDRTKWIKIAEKNGVNKSTFYYRTWKYGWDEETAATTPTLTNEQIAERSRKRKRKYPEWVYEELKKNNVPHQSFLNRMNQPNTKWTMEEACTAPGGTRLDDWRLRHYQSS